MFTINMLSKAEKVQGQGVLSAYREQVGLVKTELSDLCVCYENKNQFCNIMHYHTINPEYYLTAPMAKSLGSATVGYVHFLPETLENSIHLPPVAKQVFYQYVVEFYKSMDYLVTVNPYFIERLEAYGVDKSKVTYIPNFVSDKTFYPLDELAKQAMRAKYQIPKDAFIVLCAGQLQKRKGFFDYIELARKMPEVTFLWAGSFAFGKVSDGYREIKAILADPPKNFQLLGLVERDKMNELYNMADLMFLPSFEELFPMTILESMNSATPILLRDLPIYEDILFDFYLRGDNVSDFATLIGKVKEDTAFRRKAQEMSYRGHLFYSREHVAQMWREFYNDVHAQSKTKRRLFLPTGSQNP